MSFWKRLFGGGGGGDGAAAAQAGAGEEYKGFTLRFVPMTAGSEYQLSGSISKDGQEHRFVRADRFGSRADAESAALAKGRQIVDEQGDKVFGQSWPPKA
jgi:hypothetical protein